MTVQDGTVRDHSVRDDGATPPPTRLRWAWLGLGHAAVGLGTVGAFLPLLPTTPFLLVAAWAYARSSPALRRRLHAHPRFGPSVRAWQTEGAISRRAKVASVVAMAASWTLAAFGEAGPLVLSLLGATLATVALYVVTRPEPCAAAAPEDTGR